MLDKLDYCEDSPSGVVWKVTFGKVKKGFPAGTCREDGYWRVGKDKQYLHRLIWEMFNGELDAGKSIDHIDGNPSNNRIENLRLVTHKENMRNSKLQGNNVSGTNGVALEVIKNYSYYTAMWIEDDGTRGTKRFSVLKYGVEDALSMAIEARRQAEVRLNHFSSRHGTKAPN